MLRSLMKRRETELNEAPNDNNNKRIMMRMMVMMRMMMMMIIIMTIMIMRMRMRMAMITHAPFLPPPDDDAENRPARSGSDDLSMWSVKSAHRLGD